MKPTLPFHLAAAAALMAFAFVPATFAGPVTVSYPKPVGAAAAPQTPAPSTSYTKPSRERAQDKDGRYVFAPGFYPKPIGAAAKN